MTLTLSFTFPWNRYHATPWGRNVNEGVAEWPPSGWRIVRALYSTWQNRAPELDEAIVLRTLGQLASPPAYGLPPHAEYHTRHYMPDEGHRQGMSGNRDKVLDAFVVVPPGAELFVRWDVGLSEDELACITTLADRLTYLGRAESVCSARVTNGEIAQDVRWISPDQLTDDGIPVSVLVPTTPLDIAGIIERPNRLRRRGYIEPPGAVRVDYPRPEPIQLRPVRAAVDPPVATAVRFVIASPAPPSRKAVLAVTHVLRQASMSAFGRRSAGKSATLAGKDHASEPLRSQHQHAHYLAFNPDSGPLLRNVVVWAPGGFSDEELEALTRLSGREIRPGGPVSGFRGCRLGLEGFGDIDQVAPELARPSTTWTSFTPFAPTRHSRQKDPLRFLLAEVTRELGFRGLPTPVEVSLARGDWLSYRRHRPSGRDTIGQARRAFGLSLTFAEPVSGPIVLGDLSHFGLGLFLPRDSR